MNSCEKRLQRCSRFFIACVRPSVIGAATHYVKTLPCEKKHGSSQRKGRDDVVQGMQMRSNDSADNEDVRQVRAEAAVKACYIQQNTA